ncbi:hypothetical protein [Devosia elaeis]|nr:hypothetical protein [Devosia elaeis]
MMTVSLAASFAFAISLWFILFPVSFGKHLGKVLSGIQAAKEGK